MSNAVKNKLPDEVNDVINFFIKNKLWYYLSENLEARSCRDAANKRNRLGHTGIDLKDELKSYFAKSVKDGKVFYLIIHCRGNDRLDFTKIEKHLHLKSPIERLQIEDLAAIFNMEYGKVNPFTLDMFFFQTNILQLFDKKVFNNDLPPYTMMTNAGHLNYGIEFKPAEIISVLNNAEISDIVQNIEVNKIEKIGIITGNGPESGIYLWNEINNKIREKLDHKFLGDISFPSVLVKSSPAMGLSMELELREVETWFSIKSDLSLLISQGATIICIACNTTQYFAHEIEKICFENDVTFVSIPQALDNFLFKNQIKSFDLIGIKYAIDFNKWSAFKDLKSKYNISLPQKNQIEKITELAFKVKQDGVTGEGINKLRDLLTTSASSDTVVIALTEISILLNSQKKSKSGKIFIDTLKLLAEEVVNTYIGKSSINTENFEDEE